MSRDNTRWGLGAAIALGVVLSCSPTGAQEKPPRSIKVILKVESQGPEGMWMQVGKDLSSTELAPTLLRRAFLLLAEPHA